MTYAFTPQLYHALFPKIAEGNLVDFWLATHYDASGADVESSIAFDQRREAFLWILERLLKEGRIKLHKNGVFLESSIEDQIETFRHAWPNSDKPYPNHPDADFYLWFFDSKCPAGIA